MKEMKRNMKRNKDAKWMFHLDKKIIRDADIKWKNSETIESGNVSFLKCCLKMCSLESGDINDVKENGETLWVQIDGVYTRAKPLKILKDNTWSFRETFQNGIIIQKNVTLSLR
jgi:hypothetical protein